MFKNKPVVDVCVATFKRPHLLHKLLVSLERQEFPNSESFRIIVVDNDPAGSAGQVVASFAESSSINTLYVIETKPGISHARNTAITYSTGDFIVFVDDDEVADPGWLAALYSTAILHDADIVCGPVLSILPKNVPHWITAGKFFERRRSKTGTCRTSCGTGNVLFSRSILIRAMRMFDPEFGLSGGSDTEFTSYLFRIGAKIVWCDEAICFEIVPECRASLRWLVLRNFRNGQINARIYLLEAPLQYKTIWLFGRIVRLMVGVILSILLIPAKKHIFLKALFSVVRNFGQLSILCGKKMGYYGE